MKSITVKKKHMSVYSADFPRSHVVPFASHEQNTRWMSYHKGQVNVKTTHLDYKVPLVSTQYNCGIYLWRFLCPLTGCSSWLRRSQSFQEFSHDTIVTRSLLWALSNSAGLRSTISASLCLWASRMSGWINALVMCSIAVCPSSFVLDVMTWEL